MIVAMSSARTPRRRMSSSRALTPFPAAATSRSAPDSKEWMPRTESFDTDSTSAACWEFWVKTRVMEASDRMWAICAAESDS